VLGLAFDQLGAHRVTAHVDARNGASAAVARRLGMRLEATHVDAEWFKGEWSTTQVFAMLDREWRSRAAGA
jgi:RimJ/RimL family protein N-acetyltransferase